MGRVRVRWRVGVGVVIGRIARGRAGVGGQVVMFDGAELVEDGGEGCWPRASGLGGAGRGGRADFENWAGSVSLPL